MSPTPTPSGTPPSGGRLPLGSDDLGIDERATGNESEPTAVFGEEDRERSAGHSDPPRLSFIVLALLVVAILYTVGRTVLRPAVDRYTTTDEYFFMRWIDVLVVGWLLWVTSSIGSFLNVVAHRIPIGKSLGGRSRCPKCQVTLASRDNVPVLGWFAIRGRCRNCRRSVSRRYPIVEAAVGVSMTLMLTTLLFNFPRPHHHPIYGGSFEHVDVTAANFARMACVVAAGFATWSIALMTWDGTEPTTAWLWGGSVVIAGIYLFVPDVMMVSWKQIEAGRSFRPGHLDAIARVLTAVVMAIFTSRTLARALAPAADLKLAPLAKDSRTMIALVALLTPVMLVIGWQTGLAVVVITSLVMALSASWLRRDRVDGDARRPHPAGRFAVLLFPVTAVVFAVWGGLHSRVWFPTDVAPPGTILAWAAAMLLSPIWMTRSGDDPGGDRHLLHDDDAERDHATT